MSRCGWSGSSLTCRRSGPDVGADLADDLFPVGEDRVVEHATVVGGDGTPNGTCRVPDDAISTRREGQSGCLVVRLPGGGVGLMSGWGGVPVPVVPDASAGDPAAAGVWACSVGV